MDRMGKGIRTLGIAAALLAGVWATGAVANVQSDVTGALSAPTSEAKNAALSSLGKANANNLPVFTQVAKLVAAGVTPTGAAGAAGALAAAFGSVADNGALTRILVTTFVEAHPGQSGDIFAAIVAAGGSQQVAAAALQTSLLAALGRSLGLVPTLPNNNPGTGANDNQHNGFVKSLFTTRLGNTEEGEIVQTSETSQSPTQTTNNIER